MMRLILRDQNWRIGLINWIWRLISRRILMKNPLLNKELIRMRILVMIPLLNKELSRIMDLWLRRWFIIVLERKKFLFMMAPMMPLRWGIGRICSNPIELWVLFNILNLRRMGVKLVFSRLMLLLRKVL
jgi:hypothetical protein